MFIKKSCKHLSIIAVGLSMFLTACGGGDGGAGAGTSAGSGNSSTTPVINSGAESGNAGSISVLGSSGAVTAGSSGPVLINSSPNSEPVVDAFLQANAGNLVAKAPRTVMLWSDRATWGGSNQ